eukprot:1560630-Pyramimonas_sp.AAC.1
MPHDWSADGDDDVFLPAGVMTGAEAIEAGAAHFTAEAHKAKQFTDTANFALRCAVCQQGLKGQKEAVEHAKTTGHGNFCEY